MIGYVDSKFKYNNSCIVIFDGFVSMVTTIEEIFVSKFAASVMLKSLVMMVVFVNVFIVVLKNLFGCGIVFLILNRVK